MLAGDLPRVAVIARDEGEAGLTAVGLTVLRPVQPMLAQTAADVAEALALATGAKGDEPPGPVSVEWKLDGARIQVHRGGDEVRICTRNLNEVTDRLPGIVDLVRSLPATSPRPRRRGRRRGRGRAAPHLPGHDERLRPGRGGRRRGGPRSRGSSTSSTSTATT